jgi:hypothetical protein
MTPKRLQALRRQIAEQPQGSWGRVVGTELLEDLDAANAELSRLQPSPAPVGGGIPELTLPDEDGFATWVVEFKVSPTWVADGFDLTEDRAMEMLSSDLAHAMDGTELGATILSAPDPERIARLQDGREDLEASNWKPFVAASPFSPALIRDAGGAGWINKFRTHDDCDGNESQGLQIVIDPMGDIYVRVHPSPFSAGVRFRTSGGGGMSPRIHAALMALVEAMDQDNQERPFS